MIDVTNLRKGVTFEVEGNIYRVLDYQHIKVARGGATIRVKVRDIRSGATLEKTFNSGDRVQDVRLEKREVQYLYSDGDLYHFMDTETYELLRTASTASRAFGRWYQVCGRWDHAFAADLRRRDN